MDRDPKNFDCTRDPIYLLQRCAKRLTEMPKGCTWYDGIVVEDYEKLPDWLRPAIDKDDDCTIDEKMFIELCEREGCENSIGHDLVQVVWHTELVFLTRDEAESYGKRKEYNYPQGWRVYCVPCDGELAKILKEYQP